MEDAFPDWGHLPADCAISLGMSVHQRDFQEAIDAVTRAGERQAFIRRLHLAHPPRRAEHNPQFDKRFWNTFVEAEAFAWAELRSMIDARFVEREGAPDIAVRNGWIEAKTIEESINESEEVDHLHRSGKSIIFRGPRVTVNPDEGFVRKFDRQQDDAIKKWKRQESGNFATFFDLRTIDFGINRDRALADVKAWAVSRAKADGVLIAVCFNHRWQDPFVIAGSWD